MAVLTSQLALPVIVEALRII